MKVITKSILGLILCFFLASMIKIDDPITEKNKALLVGTSANKTWYFIKSNFNGIEAPKPSCSVQGYMKFSQNGTLISNDCNTGIDELDTYQVQGNKLIISEDTVTITDLSEEVLLIRYNINKRIADTNVTKNRNNYYEILLQTRIP